MYLAMARVAEREGYPEIAEAYKRYAYEEADHASRFAELLGEVVTDSTKKNLMMRAEAECGACSGKMDLAKKAKALNLDAIHDTVHEMAKDEARHGRGFEGLLKRYFNTGSLSKGTPVIVIRRPGVQFAAAAGAAFFVVKYLQKSSQPLQLFYGICIFQALPAVPHIPPAQTPDAGG